MVLTSIGGVYIDRVVFMTNAHNFQGIYQYQHFMGEYAHYNLGRNQ